MGYITLSCLFPESGGGSGTPRVQDHQPGRLTQGRGHQGAAGRPLAGSSSPPPAAASTSARPTEPLPSDEHPRHLRRAAAWRPSGSSPRLGTTSRLDGAQGGRRPSPTPTTPSATTTSIVAAATSLGLPSATPPACSPRRRPSWPWPSPSPRRGASPRRHDSLRRRALHGLAADAAAGRAAVAQDARHHRRRPHRHGLRAHDGRGPQDGPASTTTRAATWPSRTTSPTTAASCSSTAASRCSCRRRGVVEEVLRQADVVSLHAVLSEATAAPHRRAAAGADERRRRSSSTPAAARWSTKRRWWALPQPPAVPRRPRRLRARAGHAAGARRAAQRRHRPPPGLGHELDATRAWPRWRPPTSSPSCNHWPVWGSRRGDGPSSTDPAPQAAPSIVNAADLGLPVLPDAAGPA